MAGAAAGGGGYGDFYGGGGMAMGGGYGGGMGGGALRSPSGQLGCQAALAARACAGALQPGRPSTAAQQRSSAEICPRLGMPQLGRQQQGPSLVGRHAATCCAVQPVPHAPHPVFSRAEQAWGGPTDWAHAGYGQGVGSGGPMRGGPRQNDWMCPVDSCRNKNFGWREFCNRCQVGTHAWLVPSGAGQGAARVLRELPACPCTGWPGLAALCLM